MHDIYDIYENLLLIKSKIDFIQLGMDPNAFPFCMTKIDAELANINLLIGDMLLMLLKKKL